MPDVFSISITLVNKWLPNTMVQNDHLLASFVALHYDTHKLLGKLIYCQVSNIRGTLVGNKIVDHSDLVGASLVGAAPTISSFWTWHLAQGEWAKKAAIWDEKYLSFGIWCVLYKRFYGNLNFMLNAIDAVWIFHWNICMIKLPISWAPDGFPECPINWRGYSGTQGWGQIHFFSKTSNTNAHIQSNTNTNTLLFPYNSNTLSERNQIQIRIWPQASTGTYWNWIKPCGLLSLQ